ncbi:YihY/virulence factor BrkB family protein [Mesorhizobium sp. ORM6]
MNETKGAGRGCRAPSPSGMPLNGWRDVLWRVWRDVGDDRLMLIAAGTSFYLLLALFPGLTAFVSLYGFAADPALISDHISYLAGLLPKEGVDLIQTQLNALAAQDRNLLSIGFLVAFAVAFWSANTGIKTLFEAINIAYDEDEKRSFLALTFLSMAFTAGAMLTAMVLIGSVALVPAALGFLSLGAAAGSLLTLLRWPVTLVVVATGISVLYRYGPSREPAKWRWITWGGCIATIVWVAASMGFSYYLENFANYNATYGSLGAIAGLMVWTWISVLILLVGAELNAELEHQTDVDSTTRPSPTNGRPRCDGR